jgi:hypothetical protein
MRGLAAAVAATILWLAAVAAEAAGWGGITPGTSRRAEVEGRFGRPTEERSVTEGGLTGAEWTYAGTRAPAGLERMVVGFGLLGPGGFVPELVRMLVLYPKPRVFTVIELVTGWGKPDGIGTEERTGRSLLRWESAGILAYLDVSGEYAEVLVFAPGTSGAAR